jgi:nucleoid-associated protein YgaU
MLLTDLNGPLPLQPRRPGSGRISRSIYFAGPAILFLCFAAFGATISRAQDQQDQSVAEAARQERARKQELQKRAKHVYTEEDLKHPNILTPEDRAQVEATRNECAQKNNCSPAQNPPESLDANSETNGKSLGEVARRLRKQKELQALKPKQNEPFHLPFSTPALASPILPERPTTGPPAQRVLRPKSPSSKTPSNVFRRDPFSAVPVRPGVRRPEVRHSEIRPSIREDIRPTGRPHARLVSPAQPKIYDRHAPPSILIQPLQPPGSSAPVQPPVLAKPVQPVASGTTLRSEQARRALVPGAITTQRTINVRAGDSLWKLAQQNLGRGNRWPELVAANPGIVDPNRIRAGTELSLPAATFDAVGRRAKTNAATTIKVRKGDTLWSLAKSNLGRSSAWPCLAAANPSISNPNRIYENQEFIFPSACYALAGTKEFAKKIQ